MEILNAVAHRVLKQRNVRGAMVVPAREELERTPELNDLLVTVLDSYNNKSSRYSGSFEADRENFRFSENLEELLRGGVSFLDFSLNALERLRLKINDVVFAGGGYLLIVRYSHQQREMLLVAKLNAQAGAIFSEDLHRVVRASYLNLDRLQVAARVDVAAWQGDENRYLSFVLKKDKDDGPSDYFQDFIGCKVDQDSKVESRKLVRVVKEFASSLVENALISEVEVPDVQRRAFDFVEALRRDGQSRMESFELLANAVWPNEPSSFLQFLNRHEDPPSAGFVPDATTLKKLSNINYVSKELSVKMTYTFKQQHVHTDGSTIVIENAPDKLIAELTGM